jgi:hypothetical protein
MAGGGPNSAAAHRFQSAELSQQGSYLLRVLGSEIGASGLCHAPRARAAGGGVGRADSDQRGTRPRAGELPAGASCREAPGDEQHRGGVSVGDHGKTAQMYQFLFQRATTDNLCFNQ